MKAPKKPTQQSLALRRLAHTGGVLCMHHTADGKYYSDAAGGIIEYRVARALIENGFVLPNKDSMYDLDPQTYRVRGTVE